MPEEQYLGALERALDRLSWEVSSTLQYWESRRELTVRVDEVLARPLLSADHSDDDQPA